VAQGATSPPERRLDSWKEIAAFFGRDERTVRRWEKESALPVHRVPGAAKGRVFAYASELDLWLSTPQALRTTTLALEPQISPVQISPVEPEVKHWRWGAAALCVGALAVCAALAAGIWLYRKSHRFAAYASVPNASRTHAKNLLATGGVDSRFVPDSIAVLPFTNVRGDANTDYLSDGITESLIGNLAHLPQLKVRSRNSVFRYKGQEVDLQKVGKDLDVSLVVSGRVMPHGDTVEVSAELTDVRENTEIWLQHYRGKNADILSLQQQIAGDIAEKLRSQLSPSERQQISRQGTDNPEAYALYLKGRYAWNKRTAADLETAISHFNQAIAKDPGYALAYLGLSEAYSVLPRYGGAPSENYPKSNAAARRALELDPTLARAHAVLAGNELQYDWDFAGGEAEFKKAWELDPNYATAHQWYAENIAMIGGRQQEALAEIDRAHQLDPLSPIINVEVGYVHILVRQYDDGIAVCKKLENENPAFPHAHYCLAYGYWGKRMYPQVIEEWKTYGQLTGNPADAEYADALEQGFRTAGWKGALAKGIEARQSQRASGYYSAFAIATLYADLGDKDQAFRWLNIAYRERDGGLVGLKTDFLLDTLRSDPRFDEMVRKVGLPQ